MQWVILSGVKPYDGRYELDTKAEPFNIVEWGWIKRLSGYLPASALEGYEGGDPELHGAFAVIALHRAGKIEASEAADVFARIAARPVGDTIGFDIDQVDEADDADPPPANSTVNGVSSGADSRMSSASPVTDQPRTGIPASAISAFDQVTSPG